MELGYYNKLRGERDLIDCAEGGSETSWGLLTLRMPFYRHFQLDMVGIWNGDPRSPLVYVMSLTLAI